MYTFGISEEDIIEKGPKEDNRRKSEIRRITATSEYDEEDVVEIRYNDTNPLVTDILAPKTDGSVIGRYCKEFWKTMNRERQKNGGWKNA